jgi:hypothetical protein
VSSRSCDIAPWHFGFVEGPPHDTKTPLSLDALATRTTYRGAWLKASPTDAANCSPTISPAHARETTLHLPADWPWAGATVSAGRCPGGYTMNEP